MDFSHIDFNRIIAGMIRAARLDKDFYEEVEHDPSYSQDALVVVIIVSLIGALGSFLGTLFSGSILQALFAFVYRVAIGVAAYYLWVYVAQYIGTRFFKGIGDVGEVQRAFGFAYAPQVLNILAAIPCVGWLIGIVTWLWSIATGFIAIRQSLDQDDTNAALTVVISAIVVFLVTALIGAILGGLGFVGTQMVGSLGQALGR